MENTISKENLDKINEIKDVMTKCRNIIGDLEIKKMRIFNEINILEAKIQKESEKALIEAGIQKEDFGLYKIDLEKGELIKK